MTPGAMPKDSPEVNIIEGQVLFEMKQPMRHFAKANAKNKVVPRLIPGAATRHVLARKASASGRDDQPVMLLRAAKSKVTEKVETECKLGDCLYFFVGHACPDFGSIVLLYDVSWTESSPGWTTPFDTGGLHAGRIHANGTDTPQGRLAYLHGHRIPLAGWQASFLDYVARHFESARAYVLGRRAHTDDSSNRLLNPRNGDRRAWTWEIQLHRDHPLFEGLLRMWVGSVFADELEFEVALMEVDAAAIWNERMDRYIRRAPASQEAPEICRKAEEEAASWL